MVTTTGPLGGGRFNYSQRSFIGFIPLCIIGPVLTYAELAVEVVLEMVEVSESAVARSIAWIKTVEESISEFGGDAFAKKVLKCTGNKCAEQMFNDCTDILGRKPETVDQLLDAMNRRRCQKLNINSLWERQENKAHLKIPECGCTLVKAGLAKPNPIHCLCSLGMMEQIFSYVCKGEVHVEILNAVGFGNDCCEFIITFEE